MFGNIARTSKKKMPFRVSDTEMGLQLFLHSCRDAPARGKPWKILRILSLTSCSTNIRRILMRRRHHLVPRQETNESSDITAYSQHKDLILARLVYSLFQYLLHKFRYHRLIAERMNCSHHLHDVHHNWPTNSTKFQSSTHEAMDAMLANSKA